MRDGLHCIEMYQGRRRPCGYAGNSHAMDGRMDKVQALIRQAERDVVLTDAVARALATLRLIHLGFLQFEETGLVIDLSDDIQRLTGALVLLGYFDERQ